MAKKNEALSALRRGLGKRVVMDGRARYLASLDNLKLSFLPEAVVRPRDERDVARVLRLANQHRVPVTVRGGGTAATGAAAPVRGGWVLDVSGWKKVRVDAAAGVARAQAGASNLSVQKAAEKKGWFYPPDPSSNEYSTIGGNIACNAGGMRGGKYGVTRDYVLGLEGFLPTGERIRWACGLKKFAAGYNLRDLWIGSEGTLGVITEAALKLAPKPAARWTGLAVFVNETAALRAAQTILRERLTPSVLEFLDRQSVVCVERHHGAPVFAERPGGALLLIELDGHPAQVEEDKQKLSAVMKERAAAFRAAAGKDEADRLWAVRRQCSQAMFQLGDTKLNEDVVLPVKHYTGLMRFTQQLKRETGLPTPVFGHVADGNFHVHVMYNRKNKEQTRKARVAARRIMEKAVELGGAVSGEHGIGLAKSPFLRLQLNKAEIGAMEKIKKALDPNGILNPGKIFEPFEVWDYEPEDIRLPWDH